MRDRQNHSRTRNLRHPIMVIGTAGFIRPFIAGTGISFTGAYDDTLKRVNGRWLIADRAENTKTADYKPPASCPSEKS